jgi:membrane protease YdiL (CAAX protease family)
VAEVRRRKEGVVTSAAVSAPARAASWGAEWLVAVCTAALVAFHYAARADSVGVHSAARGWSALTLPPLPHPLHFPAAALLLGAVPVLAARLLGRLPGEVGLGAGNSRAGLAWLAFGWPLAVAAGKIGSLDPAMRSVYPLEPGLTADAAAFATYAALQFLYFGAWEVMFRGVLLFGLAPRLGFGPANLIQTALSVTAHFGRAPGETLAALAAGPLFGWVSFRVGSVWPIAVVHWTVGVSLDWFILTGGALR